MRRKGEKKTFDRREAKKRQKNASDGAGMMDDTRRLEAWKKR
jgi:hypothetical protein